MHAFAHQQVGEADARGQHPHAYFTVLRLGAFFFDHPECLRPAVVSDNDARVSHESLLRLPGDRLNSPARPIRNPDPRPPQSRLFSTATRSSLSILLRTIRPDARAAAKVTTAAKPKVAGRITSGRR